MFRLLLAAVLAIAFVSLISPVVRGITEPPVREAIDVAKERAENFIETSSGTIEEYRTTFLDRGPASLFSFWKGFVEFSKETREEYDRLTGETRQRIDDVQTGVQLIQEGKGLIEQGIKGRGDEEDEET